MTAASIYLRPEVTASTQYITPDTAQSYAIDQKGTFQRTLANGGYTGTYSLHSGFDWQDYMQDPEQVIYIILDSEVSDELRDAVKEVARPFKGIVITPNDVPSEQGSEDGSSGYIESDAVDASSMMDFVEDSGAKSVEGIKGPNGRSSDYTVNCEGGEGGGDKSGDSDGSWGVGRGEEGEGGGGRRPDDEDNDNLDKNNEDDFNRRGSWRP